MALGSLNLINDALEQIVKLPHAWPVWPGRPGMHRRVVTKLPCTIVYSIERGTIFVIPVEHTKRRPGYWLARL